MASPRAPHVANPAVSGVASAALSQPGYEAYDTVVDTTELMTGEAVGLELRPTSFVLRAAGTIIDLLTYIALFFLLLFGFFLIFQPVMDDALGAALVIATLAFSVVIVPTAVETLSRGKSLGKLAVGARIVRDDGGAIGFRHAFIRALVGVLELIMTAGGIAAIVALLNDRSKRLGDLLAGTYSQHERVSKLTPPIFGVPLALSEWAKTADVARMPDGLARRIAQFLRQAGGLTADTRIRLSQELAAEASRYVSPVPRESPEIFLAAVAAVRRDREYRALQLQQQRLATLAPVLGGLPHKFPQR
ncbi:MAG: RDD family protein [Lacisediminihabitans sp.]